MTFDELLEDLRVEYWATLCANPHYQDEFAPRIKYLKSAPSFYEFLLTRGFNRWQLSAHGVGKDVEA